MLAILKTPTTLAIIALLTLLLASLGVTKVQSNQLKELDREVALSSATNARLNATIVSIQKELTERPKELIETTKEVYRELCYGEDLAGQILNLPPLYIKEKADEQSKMADKSATNHSQKENTNEKRTAGIDDLLPPDLKLLLK